MRCCLCEADGLGRLYTKSTVPIWCCQRCRQVCSDKAVHVDEAIDQDTDYYSERNTVLNAITRTRYLELLDQLEPFRQTNRLLDIGCGFGFFLATAAERRWEVYGTERSPSARPYFERLNLPAERLVIGDVATAGLTVRSFDVAVLIEVIEHATDPARLLRAAAELVRPGDCRV